MLTVAETMLVQLKLWGVKRIYGVPGDAIFGWMDAIGKQDDIRFIAVKHESTAALMASAEAKLTGGLGVCASQMGPGIANLVNGLGDAFMDGAPVLAVTGQAPRSKLGTLHRQTINQQELVQAITGDSRLAVDPDAAVEAMGAAMRKALGERTVAHLSLPQDVFGMLTSAPPVKPSRLPEPLPDPDAVEETLRLMREAKRPMMLLGTEARKLPGELQELAGAWGCGIALGYGAAGAVPEACGMLLGGLGEGGNPQLPGLFQQADVVLAVMPDEWPDQGVPKGARIVQLDRRAENVGRAAVPADIGLIGRPVAGIRQLIQGLKGYAPNAEWMEQIRSCKTEWDRLRDNWRETQAEPAAGLHPEGIIRALNQAVDADAVMALDEGDSTLWFLRGFRAERQQVLLSRGWRTMGFGLPAAMAAKLADPSRQVVCVTGDGGLGMVLADLLTAARYELNVTVIVFHNDTLQLERDKMHRQSLVPEGTLVTNPDFVRLAEACGWDARRIAGETELGDAIRQAKTSRKPLLLDVPAAQVPHPDFS